MSKNNVTEKIFDEVKVDWEREISGLESIYKLLFSSGRKTPTPLPPIPGQTFSMDAINDQMKPKIDWSVIDKIVEDFPESSQQKEFKNTVETIYSLFDFEIYLVKGGFANSVEVMRQMRIKSLKSYKKQVSRNIGALEKSTESLSTHEESQGRAKLTNYVLDPLVAALKKLKESEQKAHIYLEFLESRKSYITPFAKNEEPIKNLTSLKIWEKIIEKLYDSCFECGFNDDESCLITAKVLSILYPEIWGSLPLDTSKKRIRNRVYNLKSK